MNRATSSIVCKRHALSNYNEHEKRLNMEERTNLKLKTTLLSFGIIAIPCNILNIPSVIANKSWEVFQYFTLGKLFATNPLIDFKLI